MRMRPWTIAAVSGVLLALSTTVGAQTAAAGSLKSAISNWVVQSLPPFIFLVPAAQVARAGDIATALEELTGLQVSTAPVGSATGGFTYRFDSKDTQTWVRSADTFGPLFSERALTTGKGYGSVGFNYRHSHYNTVAGMDLSDGSFLSLKNAQINAAVPGSAISTSRTIMDVSSDSMIGFLVFGVTNDVDVGVAIPLVRVSVSLDQSFYNSAGTDLEPGRHTVMPRTSSSGIGDVLVFGKYHFLHAAGGGLAGEVTVQIPSGDTDNLRGAGVTRTSLLAIASRGGKVSPHANFGYELWSGKALLANNGSVYAQNQLKYALGVELEANRRVTVVVDLLGRRLMNGGRLGYETFLLQSAVPGGPSLGSFQGLVPIAGGLNEVSIAPSVKWNPWKRALVSVGLLGSLVNDGVRSNVTPVLGFEWSF